MDHSNHGMTTDPDDMHGGHDMSGMSHMMMVFHSGYKETVLFPEWITTNKGGQSSTPFSSNIIFSLFIKSSRPLVLALPYLPFYTRRSSFCETF